MHHCADVQPHAGSQQLLRIMWALWASFCCTLHTHLPSRGVSFKLYVAEQFSCTLKRTKGCCKADTGAGKCTLAWTEQEAEISFCVCLRWGHLLRACAFLSIDPLHCTLIHVYVFAASSGRSRVTIKLSKACVMTGTFCILKHCSPTWLLSLVNKLSFDYGFKLKVVNKRFLLHPPASLHLYSIWLRDRLPDWITHVNSKTSDRFTQMPLKRSTGCTNKLEEGTQNTRTTNTNRVLSARVHLYSIAAKCYDDN